jgi:hypothetical protein
VIIYSFRLFTAKTRGYNDFQDFHQVLGVAGKRNRRV